MADSKRKDNSKKKPYVREQHTAAKRAGRPKQRWVPDGVTSEGSITGHWEWEKVNA